MWVDSPAVGGTLPQVGGSWTLEDWRKPAEHRQACIHYSLFLTANVIWPLLQGSSAFPITMDYNLELRAKINLDP